MPVPPTQEYSVPVLLLEPHADRFMVARQKVLEIGTGSGYQTAVLAQLAAHVYTVERHPQLAREAQETLSRLGLTNVTVLVGDGSQGLREQAPYDAIVVS